MILNDTHYRVIQTNAIGRIIDMNIISFNVELEFSDEKRKVFNIDELEATTRGWTPLEASKNGQKKDPIITKRTIDHMLELLYFMRKQTKPLKRFAIEAGIGFSCLGLISFHVSRFNIKSLERLGLVKCNRSNSRRFLYSITEKGLVSGEEEIKAQLTETSN